VNKLGTWDVWLGLKQRGYGTHPQSYLCIQQTKRLSFYLLRCVCCHVLIWLGIGIGPAVAVPRNPRNYAALVVCIRGPPLKGTVTKTSRFTLRLLPNAAFLWVLHDLVNTYWIWYLQVIKGSSGCRERERRHKRAHGETPSCSDSKYLPSSTLFKLLGD